MTIAARNRMLAAFFTLEIALAGTCLVSIAGILLPPAPGTLPLIEGPRAIWIPEILPIFPDAAEALISSAILCLISLLGGLWLMISFRRTTAREILCFGAFLCSLGFEAFRAVTGWTATAGAPPEFIAFLTRAVWFGRGTGILSLFVASLYSSEFKYEEPGKALGICAFVSLVMAVIIPVASDKLNPNLLFSPGYTGTMSFLWVSMGIISVLNFCIAAFRRNSRDYIWMGGGLAIMSIGRDGLMFPSDLLIEAVSVIALWTGLIILVRRSYRRSLLD